LASFYSELILNLWILYTVSRTPWTGDQSLARPLPTQSNIDTEEMQTDIHVSRGTKYMTPVFEWAQTFRALDRAFIVIVTKLLFKQFLSIPYYFIPLLSQYSPQNPVLKCSQSMLYS
jgi:hypothetical protein